MRRIIVHTTELISESEALRRIANVIEDYRHTHPAADTITVRFEGEHRENMCIYHGRYDDLAVYVQERQVSP